MFLYHRARSCSPSRTARSKRWPTRSSPRSSRNNRTHYLNILHASWPAGLVLGGLVGWILGEGMHVSWKLQLGLFLVPTVLYGLAFFGQTFPKSEASAKGLSIGADASRTSGILGALVACVLVGLFFKEQLGAHSRVLHREPRSSPPLTWGYLSWAVGLRVCCWSSRSRPISPSDRCCCSCCS